MLTVLLYLLLSVAGFHTVDVIAPADGTVRAKTYSEEGPGFDPNGRPRSLRINTDEGNGIDPHG